jgi:hypothetical protein
MAEKIFCNYDNKMIIFVLNFMKYCLKKFLSVFFYFHYHSSLIGWICVRMWAGIYILENTPGGDIN